ncbi:MAG: hypothetical protein M3R68_08395 [Acidobacteriota bacterium]|nr:hypothetical protein [Acidobacteriota bacterium]
MKIVIFGLARSGTTALFYKIKNSLGSDTVCLFEPRSFDARAVTRKRLGLPLEPRPEPDVLAKVLPFRPDNPVDVDSFSHFDSQVLIVRDPRDRLISRLLYGVFHSDLCRYDEKVRSFLEVLEQKEADPKSVTLKTLLTTFARLNGESFSLDGWARSYWKHSIRKPLDFAARRSSLFLIKYEDLVDGRVGGLEGYLRLSLKGQALVDPEFDRVARTKGYGGWRNWFTPADVDYLRPLLQTFLDRYYPEADWDLSLKPSIPSEHGSRYVERLVNERRASLMQPPFV